MLKYKRKRKKNITILISIAIIAVLISINIGYALWSERLEITGDVNLKYVEPKLENLTFNQTDGQYVERYEAKSPKRFEVLNTELTDDAKLKVFGEIQSGMHIVIGRDVEMSIYFVNNNPVPLTSGTYVEMENNLGYDITFTMPETVAVGETAKITIGFYARSSMTAKTGNVIYRVAYKVEEITRYLYFELNLIDD